MPFRSNDFSVDRLMQRVVALTGETETQALINALEMRLKKLESQRIHALNLDEIDEIVERFNNLPLLDHRSDDEIVGYGAFGLPE
jgi:antitoxin VapB